MPNPAIALLHQTRTAGAHSAVGMRPVATSVAVDLSILPSAALAWIEPDEPADDPGTPQ